MSPQPVHSNKPLVNCYITNGEIQLYPSLANMSPQWFLLWCVLKLIFLELMQEEHAIRHIGTRTVRTNVNIIDGIYFEKIPKDPNKLSSISILGFVMSKWIAKLNPFLSTHNFVITMLIMPMFLKK